MLALIWGLIAWMISLPAKVKRAQIEANRKKSLELIGQVLASHDAGAVSYTHLDVYKRQLMDRGGRVSRFKDKFGGIFKK